jgi:hypothetical protein
MDERDEEFHRLRGCVRNLTALSALPLIWVGQEAPEVVASFLETLLVSLRLDLRASRIRRTARQLKRRARMGSPGSPIAPMRSDLRSLRRYRPGTGCAKRSRYRIQCEVGC